MNMSPVFGWVAHRRDPLYRACGKRLILISGLLFGAGCGREASSPITERVTHLYVTQDTIEVDTLASLWLIVRYVDNQATFQFIPKGTLVTKGIAFDTPDADYRRTATASCFERILQKNNLADPKLLQLGRMIHDIEINFWGEKKYAQTLEVQQAVNAIIDKNKNEPQACMQDALHYFDGLHPRL